MFTVAFDVDGTLIDYNYEPKPEVVALASALITARNVRVIVWSGGGQDYAQQMAKKCGLKDVECFAKFDANVPVVDVAFDDDIAVRGVRKLFILKAGDQPAMEPLGDCRLCVQNRDETWGDHDWVEMKEGFTLCKICSTRHRVNKATHLCECCDEPVCDDCED